MVKSPMTNFPAIVFVVEEIMTLTSAVINHPQNWVYLKSMQEFETRNLDEVQRRTNRTKLRKDGVCRLMFWNK